MSCHIQELRAERVCAGCYVRPKTLLCHFNVPDARLLRVLLWLRTKEEVVRFYACVVAEKDEEVCVVANKHSVAGIGRLHGFHHY